MFTIPRKVAGIYQLTCTASGKIYIGSAQDIRYRWRKHYETLLSGTHWNPHLQRAWNKYGASAFRLDILEIVMFPEHLIAREQFYLDTLRPYDHTIGFNISHYADAPMRGRKASEATLQKYRERMTGKPVSEAARRKISEAKKGKPQPWLRTPDVVARAAASRRGRKHTAETRAKISESARQRYATPRHIVTTPDGEELLVHLASFCREHGLYLSCMYNVVAGRVPHHRGWKARLATN